MSNENQREGLGHQAKGTAKEVAGKLTDNEKMEAEGKMEKAGGQVQETAGDIEEKFKKD
ncbi:CsbD family protein [Notoacmeibacter sp. MSK16QG-6]|uniref:CsbD family protein n=1 Tax=Notoacmeibacter sp. MSK16QG-6 TaxID=2957982 RepID=UPI00209C8BFB|nr:CsbD family protein [Notoacmeibacter sp. MSK16QG-6]MCP1199019.1 CsbD family protein [Notoacmeibacter sp. MSK16QG-6]